MAITTNAICDSFKKELLQGKHDFDTSSDTYKLAMYTSSATLGKSISSSGIEDTSFLVSSLNSPSKGGISTKVDSLKRELLKEDCSDFALDNRSKLSVLVFSSSLLFIFDFFKD